jgi:hypothetical protein
LAALLPGKAAASCAPLMNARVFPRVNILTADTQPFDQAFVTTIVRAPEVIQNLAALRHELEQAAPRMVVFDMRLEVFRQIVDPLGEQRNLDFGRAGIAGFGAVRFDDFRLTRGRYRHRH